MSAPPHSRTEQAQTEAIRKLRGGPRTDAAGTNGASIYAGLVTRAIALALDGVVVNGAALLVGVTVGLALSILHLPSDADAAIAAVMGVLWVIWSFSYFVFFWSTTGQTPGSRVMSIRVIDAQRRGPLKPRRALLRFGALWLAAIPLFAGYLMMLWDDRSRCFQDRVARTVVVYVPVVS
ncbi:MAG: RDD family protein [Solirubrobacteraceae bacterium]